MIPRIGDFLTYNNSAIKPDGSLNYTNVVWNLTFATKPSASQDVFGVTFQSFYPGLSSSNYPMNGSSWIVNVADMIVDTTTGFPFITPSDLPMSFPFLLPTNMSFVGSKITVTSQSPSSYELTVVDEENVTLNGTIYPCWNASGQSGLTETTNVLFTKSAGIVLYLNRHSALVGNFESNIFQILTARVGDYAIVSEFLPLISLPLLVGASFVAVFFRRKQKRTNGLQLN